MPSLLIFARITWVSVETFTASARCEPPRARQRGCRGRRCACGCGSLRRRSNTPTLGKPLLLKGRNKGVRQACIEWIKYEGTDRFRVRVEPRLGDLIGQS